MSDPIHQQVLGHLLGALDDEEEERVDALLEHDEPCCRALRQWRERLAAIEPLRPDYDPPPGLAQRTSRFVAACAPVAAEHNSKNRKRGLSPCPMPPGSTASIGWLDAAVLSFFGVAALILILPAIDGSRFEARVASCQNGLRQLASALSQYSEQQTIGVSQLADAGRLTQAGIVAVDQIREVFGDGLSQTVCPESWLAVQGHRDAEKKWDCVANRPQATPVTLPTPIPRVEVLPIVDIANVGPGTRCIGTNEGRPIPTTPADVPLLADAPSADLPGLSVATHRGRGRNVVFGDGHAVFLSGTMPGEAVDPLLGSAQSSFGAATTPIVFVNGR